MLEPIEKLREFVADINEFELNDQIVWTHEVDGSESVFIRPDFVSGWHRAVDKTIDNLEAEIAEKYMELPVDADGVPIHVGDSIEYPNGERDVVRFITVNDNMPTFNESGWIASKCRHVKPRTVEDVLSDFRFRASLIYDDPNIGGEDRAEALEELDAKYADEIRKVVGE